MSYLHHRMELPNDTELCEKVFLAQPKAQRIKYMEKHCIVETDMLKLQEFFEGCHNADVCSGVYSRILEGKKPTDVQAQEVRASQPRQTLRMSQEQRSTQ